ncbi:hypothetical protein [Spongiactinospora sp. 9N601]|uniref:hypothetical protein n=1 Tax=Spongiactinospora sp. 9N601 TaxID=3375149 RepID=UPI0037963853
MNGWFTRLVVETINPAFVMVGQVLLSSPPPSMLARVRELSDHVRLIANALLGLFVLAGGVIVMSYGSVQTSTTVQEIAPRLVVAAIAVNFSLTVCEYAVQLANDLVTALLGQGVDGRRAGDLLAGKVAGLITDTESTLLFLVLMVGVAVLLGIVLAFIAFVRITLLLFLIIAAPLALLCHALPQTEGIARLWWRGFTGVLAIQVLQALALILAFKVYLTQATDVFTPPPPDAGTAETLLAQPIASQAIDALILIGILFVLIKIPGWVARTIWQQAQPNLLKRLIKAVIVYKALGAISGARRAARRRTRPGPGKRQRRAAGPRSGGAARQGPRPASAKRPPTSTGAHQVKPPTRSGGPPRQGAAPQQLQLPLDLPPAARRPTPSAQARQGRQTALPFPVTRVPRPPAPPTPPPSTGPWIRPRPPYVQDRLPGMPTRPPRPGQLRLRLDPPPRRTPRKHDQ